MPVFSPYEQNLLLKPHSFSTVAKLQEMTSSTLGLVQVTGKPTIRHRIFKLGPNDFNRNVLFQKISTRRHLPSVCDRTAVCFGAVEPNVS